MCNVKAASRTRGGDVRVRITSQEGPLPIGRLFHLIHLTKDVRQLEAWYDEVFSVKTYLEHSYSPHEMRDASLVVLGDAVLEPLSPAFRVPGWDAVPLGRFHQRFGPHWHSIAWHTDDVGEVWERCVRGGIRVVSGDGSPADVRPGPDGIIMTHPKDTFTQLQFMGPRPSVEEKDPRLAPSWDARWWIENHPVRTSGLAYATVLTRDPARAERVYVDVLGGTLLRRSSSALTGTDDVYVRLGQITIQLATPTSGDTLAAQDLARNNEILHAAAFQVEDLDETAAYLAEKGIKTLARDEETLLTDPGTTFDAPFRWTTRPPH